MKIASLIPLRLINQHLSNVTFTTPAEVVRWFGAVQAQDFYGSLWNIGQRMTSATENSVEQAIADKTIIRTWPMRGTLHFVSPHDVHWMLPLLTPRIVQKAQTNYKKYELDTKTFTKSRTLFENALRDNKILTRTELYDVLSKGKINIGEERGIHIINNSAMAGLLCFGPRIGKQHTFVLLDDWVPNKNLLSREESLAELTKRYFASHGPATVHDFAWWSGLTIAEVKRGIQLAEKHIVRETFDKVEYYKGSNGEASPKLSITNLLSWYDEFIIGYKDRSATFDPTVAKHIPTPRNGVYSPLILLNGKISGTWKPSRDNGTIHIQPFIKFTTSETASLNKAVSKYKRFVGI